MDLDEDGKERLINAAKGLTAAQAGEFSASLLLKTV